ncbi:hypothetical protein llap_3664 [Limosa lapponica baueri]|uniref:Uncharacterized protein n=1 Tax=Limosa lapponica baueri TaxID=1758121 RepID=A0A2I0UJ14_LIMLA|nr:hypothetical protein llap_3664 [Limosa lapponica baueri]
MLPSALPLIESHTVCGDIDPFKSEKFHGYRISWTLTLFLKLDPNAIFKAKWIPSVDSVWYKQENGELQSPNRNPWLLTACLEQPPHLSFKDGGQCQTLMEDFSSLLVMLRKGDHEKWRKDGGSFRVSPGNMLNK